MGVIKDCAGNILISLRPDTVHQGGLWEFPGGKVEIGESVQQALSRELKEELNLTVQAMQPLIKINHQYDDLAVVLDVWTVTQFSGNPFGCEGQKINWVKSNQLLDFSFPKANYPIINAARLPNEYAILNTKEERLLMGDLLKILESGVKLVQVRLKSLSAAAVNDFFQLANPLCKEKGVQLLVNSAVKNAHSVDANGLHLTSMDLMGVKQRPADYQWVAASCHNRLELQHAERIGIDFVVLAPVLATKTHPNAKYLGWNKFEQLVALTNLPVYALGGMTRKHQYPASIAGAQGISGITAFFE